MNVIVLLLVGAQRCWKINLVEKFLVGEEARQVVKINNKNMNLKTSWRKHY